MRGGLTLRPGERGARGPAVAGTPGIVAACDVAIAVSRVSFPFTEARLDIVPAIEIVASLGRGLA